MARALAIVGMVMVHFGPSPAPDTALGSLYGLSHGRASVLFALLAGVGVALLVGSRSSGVRAGVRGRLMLRGVLLLPLGLWLQDLDHGALVILQYYAVYFLFIVLVLGLPDRWLLAGTGLALVGGPLLYLGGQSLAPEWYLAEAATIGDPAGKLLRDLLLSGAYPLVTWSAPLLAGLWIGRRDLSGDRVRWWLLGAGTAAAGAAALAAGMLETALGGIPDGSGLAQLATDEPHSQMPLWMLGSVGSACAVLGGMLLLCDRLPRAAWPLAATGQLALTVYVGHLLLLHLRGELFEREEVPEAFLTVGTFFALSVAACVLWRAVLPRGPLEAALAAPWQLLVWAFSRLAGDRDGTR